MGILRVIAHARQRTFMLGFLSAMFLMSLWLMIFVTHLEVTIQKRDVPVTLQEQMIYTQHLNWQKVVEGRSYALSAFVDKRGKEPVVKVILMEKMGEKPHLCLLWLPWRTEPIVVDSEFVAIGENHGKDYWIHIYSCPLNGTTPVAVSVVPEFTKVPPNILQVQDSSQNNLLTKREFTVCVAVLHKKYNDVHELVEAIEVNQMFGAQKIVIYDYSVGYKVAKYLKYYMDENLVDVIKWTLPDGVDESEIHYYAQVAAVNDCIYRYMYTTKFMLISDLDEIFVPRKFSNWGDTMKSIMKISKQARWSGAYLLQNAFFPLDCEDQEEIRDMSLVKHYNLRSLLKTIRLSPLWPHGVRSKYVIRPEAVTVAGIHHMWGFAGNFTHYNIPPSMGILHHYRYYLNGCSSWAEDSFMWTKDKFLLNYKRDITKRVWRTLAILGDCRHKHKKHLPKRTPRQVL